ncbi:hypothetical protein C772_03228 [Bhargavaea cecembensis DSE10]|uniref:Uncharacterized protein n=1 Tax=Bhargavaea cecembensis DSE10 TaxID=1235279 RepID=M7P2R6_9BACL|nr:hypothetical protein C772_03228 [Bhargavaea cecembensis DSE10]
MFQGFIFKGFPGLGFQFLIDRVPVNLTVPFRFSAKLFQRAVTAVFALIDLEVLNKAGFVLFLLVFLELDLPSVWADEQVVLFVILPVLRIETIVFETALLFFYVSAIWNDKFSFRFVISVFHKILVVFFASVSRIGDNAFRHRKIGLPKGLQVRNQATGISRALVDGIEEDKLVLGGHLNVVARFELAVFHMVVLHSHERGVRIRFRIAVPVIPADIKLNGIFFFARNEIIPDQF